MSKILTRRLRLETLFAPQVSASGPQSIRSVEAWNVKEPASNRGWCVLHLATADGQQGWGECARLSRESFEQLRTAIQGHPVHAYESLGLLLRGHPGWAAVNAASLDILGKQAKAPVFQLLGGPTRNKVRAFASLAQTSDDEMARSIERLRSAGFRAFAFPAPEPPFRNSGKAFVVATKQRFAALQRGAGVDADFVLAGGGRLTPGDAASLSAAFEHEHLLWFDEPCQSSSLAPVSKIASENVTPLGFGMGAVEASFFQNLLRADAIDVVRPEIARHGITGVRKIAALAEVYYIAAAPRHSEGPITTAAALQLAASLPNFFIQHIPYPQAEADREMRAALTGRSIESVKDGFMELRNQPGLGVEVQMSALQKYGERIA